MQLTQTLEQDTQLLRDEANALWATLKKKQESTLTRRNLLNKQMNALAEAVDGDDADVLRREALHLYALLNRLTKEAEIMPEELLGVARTVEIVEVTVDVRVVEVVSPYNELRPIEDTQRYMSDGTAKQTSTIGQVDIVHPVNEITTLDLDDAPLQRAMREAARKRTESEQAGAEEAQ